MSMGVYGLELFSDGLIPAARPFVRLAPVRQMAFLRPCGRLACLPNGLRASMRPAGLSAKRTASGHAAGWP